MTPQQYQEHVWQERLLADRHLRRIVLAARAELGLTAFPSFPAPGLPPQSREEARWRLNRQIASVRQVGQAIGDRITTVGRQVAAAFAPVTRS